MKHYHEDDLLLTWSRHLTAVITFLAPATMGFQQTLRLVQMTRAITIVSTCISVIMFAFIVDMRYGARKNFAHQVQQALPGIFESKTPTRSAFGSLALLGLALSLIWNGLCMFDLCVKKHYRFDRRICIFVDIFVAIALLITGFLNFGFDCILYFALDIATKSQMRLEIAAIIFLATSCLLHFGFFCYGCKDPAAHALEFEHVPLEPTSPMLLNRDFDPEYTRSRGNTLERQANGLVEIDLGKKVQIIKVQQKMDAARTPPRTPREGDNKRSGFVGTPAQISQGHPQEASPFLDDRHQHGQEWI
ncbi:hypothetical protein KVT40_008255 [Elsinoe batatas]|uniref:Uncharacterized protein n=1 Tax=Elsinoe batatas TaxID=2601811 RepID=A0A8K0PF72_9PEZI|nr:hypothetical protein KVT40_008255 [Elsinoe batatas]